MTDNLNIKILEQKGFKKIKLIDTGSVYHSFTNVLSINLTLKNLPDFDNFIIDVKDFLEIIEKRLKEYNINTIEQYDANNVSCVLYIYFIVKKTENKMFSVYFENGYYLDSIGYKGIRMNLNSYSNDVPNHPVLTSEETEINIKYLYNYLDIYRKSVWNQILLTRSIDEEKKFTSQISNEPFFQFKEIQPQTEPVEYKKRVNDSAYNYLLGYYLYHEKFHRCNKK